MVPAPPAHGRPPTPARLAALAVAAVALWGSAACVEVIDHGVTPCAPETCAGCCSEGVCLAGDNIYACGAGGSACAVCDSAEACLDGACLPAFVQPPPKNPPDAGYVCGPATCAGCCQENVCVSYAAQSLDACGTSGSACRACDPAGSCSAGVCRGPSACDLRASFVSVSGTGRIDFGKTPVGTSHRIDVELTNNGGTTCHVSAPTWDSSTDRNAFSFAGANVYPFELPPRQKVRFPVTFAPYTARAWQDAQNAFTFVADDGAPSQCPSGVLGCRRVIVSGEGVASALVPSAPVVPSELEFGEVAVGCEAGWRQVLLVNESAQPLEVSAASVSGAAFELQTPPLPLMVPAFGTAHFRVRFVPTATGTFNGALQISDALSGARSIPLSGTGVPSAVRSETFLQQTDAYTDVLLVVHNAPGTEGLQQAVADHAGILVQKAQATGGYRFGVITSDATQASAGRLQGSPRFVTAAAPSPAAALGGNLRVGTSGGIDQSFEAARLAVLPPNASDPLRNGGFLRAEARLGLVFVTNSAEKSGAAIVDYARAFAVATGRRLGSERLRAWTLVEGSCQPGSRYAEAMSLLGGQCRSLSSVALADALTDVAEDLFARRTEFALSEPVDVTQPVSVTVDGAPVPSPQYVVVDAARNSVRFQPGYAPEQGQQVDVTYAPDCHP